MEEECVVRYDRFWVRMEKDWGLAGAEGECGYGLEIWRCGPLGVESDCGPGLTGYHRVWSSGPLGVETRLTGGNRNWSSGPLSVKSDCDPESSGPLCVNLES